MILGHLSENFFLLKLPFFINHVAPVAVLVSSLVTLGILNRNRELTAIRSSGIMLYHICYPIVIWGLIVSGAVFINNEFVVPSTEKKKIEIKDRLFREEARRLADLSWKDLGLPVADVVTASSGDRAAHYVVNATGTPMARHYERESAHG